MSWRDISLTWPCYQTRDGAMILSRVAFTCGPRPAESSSLVLRRNGCFGSFKGSRLRPEDRSMHAGGSVH